MRRARFLVPGLVLAFAACTEDPNPGGGGYRTAEFMVESFVADAKVTACMGQVDNALFKAVASLPVTDGYQSKLMVGGQGRLADLMSAPNCDAVFIVLNRGEAPATCSGGKPACLETVAQTCEATSAGSLMLTTDCSGYGMACEEGECTLGQCASGSCDGDTLVACKDGGHKQLVQCGFLGLGCGRGAEGLQCQGRGDSCSVDTVKPACDGAKFTLCLGGHQAVIDCAQLTDGRRACNQQWLDQNKVLLTAEEIVDGHLAQACAPTGFECEDKTSSCDGDVVQICVDGLLMPLSCRDLGFDGCKVKGGQARCEGFPAALP